MLSNSCLVLTSHANKYTQHQLINAISSIHQQSTKELTKQTTTVTHTQTTCNKGGEKLAKLALRAMYQQIQHQTLYLTPSSLFSISQLLFPIYIF